jgi:hypothetical protein
VADLLEELEKDARARFVRWDPALWRALCEGPAQQLSENLLGKSQDLQGARKLVEQYLRLGREGVGLGYLFPASAGTENVFSLFWNRLLPQELAELPEPARADALAQAWNLSENLEHAPVWLRRIFHRSLRELDGLGELADAVSRVEAQVQEAPSQPLHDVKRLQWIHLGAEDKRFLPGALHFLAPRVVCVHDRERTTAGGRDATTFGVWLGDAPFLLGPMGCKELVARSNIQPGHLYQAEHLDPRFGDVYDAKTEAHAVAATLTTSQFLVVLQP